MADSPVYCRKERADKVCGKRIEKRNALGWCQGCLKPSVWPANEDGSPCAPRPEEVKLCSA